MPLDILHSAIDKLALAPGVRHLRKHKWDRVFEHNPGMNLFRGVYSSFDEAAASMPVDQRGYDDAKAADLYQSWTEPKHNDYPALFWIQRSLADGMRSICDLGGNIGFKYVAFKKVALFPRDLRWLVIDLPAITARGRTFAQEQGAAAVVSFANDLSAAEGHDLLFASGSLQYLPRTLPQILLSLQTPPKRIVANITPLHPTRSYFTVNSFGPGFAAYRVQKQEDFINAVERCGYAARDTWQNLNKRLDMPLHPELSLDHYTGVCFDRWG